MELINRAAGGVRADPLYRVDFCASTFRGGRSSNSTEQIDIALSCLDVHVVRRSFTEAIYHENSFARLLD